MDRLDTHGALQFVDDNAALLDAQDNLFASSAFLRMFIRAIPARSYLAQKVGDSVILVQEDGTLSSCYVESALTVASVTTSERDAVEHFFRQLHQPVLRLQPLADTRTFHSVPGWYTREFFVHDNWYMVTRGMSYEDYCRALPWKQRDRRVRTFKGTVSLERPETGMKAFLDVYEKSWKQPEPHPAFVPAFMQMCAEQGWLRIAVARVDGVPVGVSLCIVRADIAYFYKVAYAEEHKKHSGGLIATAAMLKHVLDVDGVDEIDFGAGGDAYKRQWATRVRQRRGVVMCRLWHPIGLARAIYEAVGAWSGRLRQRMSEQRPRVAAIGDAESAVHG